MEDKQYAVYILASRRNGTVYIGVTNDLIKRVWQHKQKEIPGFTAKYNVNKLIYYKLFDDIEEAIKHEKQLKNWKRKWKIELIEKENPQWKNLYDELI